MKCTNRKPARQRPAASVLAGILVCTLLFVLSGCGRIAYEIPYDANSSVSSFNVLYGESGERADGFSAELCVLDPEDLLGDGSVDITSSEAAVLFDLSAREVLYAKNAHERLYPASLTKIMTALVALKYGSQSQTLTATENVKVTETGATVIGLKAGDSMTLDQALRILLLRSANDVANLIAENIGGSIQGFVDLMNEEAASIGASNTHFMNPNGLTDEEHYTTAYDLYLMFHKAIQYQEFVEIIQMSSYDGVYYDTNGNALAVSVANTNGYVNGERTAPANVTIVGGKTGTTSAAGHCLILLARDRGGDPYIAVALKAETSDALYSDMGSLLGAMSSE